MTPTGTNLLGLVKHVASVEAGYFGETFGRPFGEPLPWMDEGAELNADLWATPGESREQITGLYRRVWAHSDRTIAELPLDAIGHVPWWAAGKNEVTLHRILVHMATETDRHAGARRHRARADRRGGRAPAGLQQPGLRRSGLVDGLPGHGGAGGPGGRRRQRMKAAERDLRQSGTTQPASSSRTQRPTRPRKWAMNWSCSCGG